MNVQMSYIILALIIFTLLALSFNQKGNSDLDSRLYHEAVVSVTELGDAFINEISNMAFDEKTLPEKIKEKIKLTTAGNLGPDAGENHFLIFDDVDDWNGYTKYDTLNRLGVCTTLVSVDYIDLANPDVIVTTQQWYKRITIEIDNFYLTDPVKLYFITSY